MAQFSLSRNAKLYVSTDADAVDLTNLTGVNTWEVPVLDGFSFTQATTTQEVSISEAGESPKRGQQIFNTALEPVNWSFSNYMRPRFDPSPASAADSVERVMWEGVAGPKANGAAVANPITNALDGHATTLGTAVGEGSTVDFAESNTNELVRLALIFELGNVWYLLPGAVVDTAEIDFSIESIASITWSGFADSIIEASNSGPISGWAAGTYNNGDGSYMPAPTAAGCIRNKLTTVKLLDNEGTGGFNLGVVAALPITGGSVTISNNITFLTPENLGQLNQPCGHFTGARTVNGNLTAYLKSGAGEDDTTAALLSELTSAGDIGQSDPQDFNINVFMGGGDATETAWVHDTPIIQLDMPHCNIVVPTINVEDVLTVDIGFAALPYDTAGYTLDAANELVVTYWPDQT